MFSLAVVTLIRLDSPLVTLRYGNDSDTKRNDDDKYLQRLTECKSLLLEAGADPTLPTNTGFTLFELAVHSGVIVSTSSINPVIESLLHRNLLK